jgi:hypothetical protein
MRIDVDTRCMERVSYSSLGINPSVSARPIDMRLHALAHRRQRLKIALSSYPLMIDRGPLACSQRNLHTGVMRLHQPRHEAIVNCPSLFNELRTGLR